jgi:hypothetical protein
MLFQRFVQAFSVGNNEVAVPQTSLGKEATAAAAENLYLENFSIYLYIT